MKVTSVPEGTLGEVLFFELVSQQMKREPEGWRAIIECELYLQFKLLHSYWLLKDQSSASVHYLAIKFHFMIKLNSIAKCWICKW